MGLLHTPELKEGWEAVDFSLKGVDGEVYTLNDLKGENGLLVMFICNHCPYVKGIMDRLPEDMKSLQEHGVGVVAVMSNDAEEYPEDSFDNMQKFAKENNFSFPYVIDETQEVAKTYGAVCTPDFFGFNADLELQYRGRLDSANNKPFTSDTNKELLPAMLEVAKTGKAMQKQVPSMGCSIKWKE